MKKIFFSDVHKDIPSLLKLLNSEDGMFYCLGDSELSNDILTKYNIISVKGNCDNALLPESMILEIDGNKILLLHGHTVNVKFDLNRLYYLTKSNDCNIVIFGHTHRMLELKEDITFYNPGSLRDGQTYIVYENNEFKFKRLE